MHFKFLSDAEFFVLAQDDKAAYLVAAVKEVNKMTALLRWNGQKFNTPDLPGLQAPPSAAALRSDEEFPASFTRRTSLPRK